MFGKRNDRPGELHFGLVESPPSEVLVRQLTEDERMALDARLKAKMRPWDVAKRVATAPEARQYPKGSVDMSRYTKDDFLRLRSEGTTVAQIAMQWGMKEESLRKNYLIRWGINKAENEVKALRTFAGVELPPETVRMGESVEVADSVEVEVPVEQEKVTHDPIPADAAPTVVSGVESHAYITIRIPLTAETALCTSATELRTQIRDDVFTLRRKIADIAHGLMEWTGSATVAEVQAWMDRALKE